MPPDASTRRSDEDVSGPPDTSSCPDHGGAQAGLLHTVLDSLVVGVLVLDAGGRVVLANRTVHETLGLPDGSLTGERLAPEVMAAFALEDEAVDSVTADTVDDIHEWWRDEPSVGPQFHEVTRLRFRYEVPGGRTRRGWITTRSGVDDDGEPIVIVSISDITAQEDERQQLRHLASTDVLTGLDNRAVLEETLDRYVRSAARAGRPSGSALFIDLDGFKQVNDELGHGAGDQVLEIVGRRLRDTFRDSDVAGRVEHPSQSGSDAVAARYGGDEFVVLTDATEAREIDALVSRVHDTITGPIAVDGMELQVEASIGWALIEPDSTVRSVLEEADRQVYEAKSLNRTSP